MSEMLGYYPKEQPRENFAEASVNPEQQELQEAAELVRVVGESAKAVAVLRQQTLVEQEKALLQSR